MYTLHSMQAKLLMYPGFSVESHSSLCHRSNSEAKSLYCSVGARQLASKVCWTEWQSQTDFNSSLFNCRWKQRDTHRIGRVWKTVYHIIWYNMRFNQIYIKLFNSTTRQRLQLAAISNILVFFYSKLNKTVSLLIDWNEFNICDLQLVAEEKSIYWQSQKKIYRKKCNQAAKYDSNDYWKEKSAQLFNLWHTATILFGRLKLEGNIQCWFIIADRLELNYYFCCSFFF